MRVIGVGNGVSKGFGKSAIIRLGAILPTAQTAIRLPRLAVHHLYGALNLVSALLFVLSPLLMQAQNAQNKLDYKTVVIFGDSLSDTGNVANLTEAKYGFRVPGTAADYTDGRFTDGGAQIPDVWVEQLASWFPSKPAINGSLAKQERRNRSALTELAELTGALQSGLI